MMEIRDHTDDYSQKPDTILEVRNTSVSFDMDRGESRVLNNVDLDIHRDEILGIVGESGSGKSMLASSLLDAVVEPGHVTGQIRFYPEEGEPIDVLDLSKRKLKDYRWEQVSMVFQGAMSSFNPTTTIKTHFEETLQAHNADIDTGMKRARELLSDLYLDEDRILESYPHELSGGMQQRTLIALSLVLDPEVLVMDEPTAALDLLMQRSILKLLQKIKEKYEITLIFITHDLPLVAELADRISVLYAFEFVEAGPTEEIIRNAAHPYTRSLLNSTPNLETPVNEMKPIDGSAPDPVDVPEGCSYHPRCPISDEECRNKDPGSQMIDTNHQAACFHWENASEIPSVSLQEQSMEEEE